MIDNADRGIVSGENTSYLCVDSLCWDVHSFSKQRGALGESDYRDQRRRASGGTHRGHCATGPCRAAQESPRSWPNSRRSEDAPSSATRIPKLLLLYNVRCRPTNAPSCLSGVKSAAESAHPAWRHDSCRPHCNTRISSFGRKCGSISRFR